MAPHRGVPERRGLEVGGIDIGTPVDHEADRLEIPLEGSRVEHGSSLRVGRIWARPTLEQEACEGRIALGPTA